MPVYRTTGHLTGHIAPENVAEAQHYLSYNGDGEAEPINMEQYLDPPLFGVIEDLRWVLAADGHNYEVLAFATRELTDDELKQLSSEVSGQNSDGLGEGFEQQDFAWNPDDECGECDDCVHGYGCSDAEMNGSMISFDWQTNELPWTRVK